MNRREYATLMKTETSKSMRIVSGHKVSKLVEGKMKKQTERKKKKDVWKKKNKLKGHQKMKYPPRCNNFSIQRKPF